MENAHMSFSAGSNLNLADVQSLVFYHTGRDNEIIKAILPKNLALLGSEPEVFEPSNISGSCTITSHRAVMRRLSDSRFSTDWLASTSLYNNMSMVTEGLIFFLCSTKRPAYHSTFVSSKIPMVTA